MEDVFVTILLAKSIDDFVELVRRVFLEIRDLFQGGGFGIKDNILLIGFVFMDGSEIKAGDRRNGLMRIEDHFFDERLLFGRSKVRPF